MSMSEESKRRLDAIIQNLSLAFEAKGLTCPADLNSHCALHAAEGSCHHRAGDEDQAAWANDGWVYAVGGEEVGWFIWDIYIVVCCI